jgi:hypothetical protein
MESGKRAEEKLFSQSGYWFYPIKVQTFCGSVKRNSVIGLGEQVNGKKVLDVEGWVLS